MIRKFKKRATTTANGNKQTFTKLSSKCNSSYSTLDSCYWAPFFGGGATALIFAKDLQLFTPHCFYIFIGNFNRVDIYFLSFFYYYEMQFDNADPIKGHQNLPKVHGPFDNDKI